MNQPLNLKPQQLSKTVRLKAENDTGEPAGMVLSIPTENGGSFAVPVLDDWQPTEEKPEGELGNTLMSICPVAEIYGKRPIETGGVTVFSGRAVSLMRPGYLYVFRGQALWREFKIGEDGTFNEVDLVTARNNKAATRSPKGKPVTDFLVPVMLQNRFELTGCRIAYSEVQWSWPYIEKLERTSAMLEKRAVSIAPAWAAAMDDNLSFGSGFPASSVASVPPLRPRDLGIELMLSDPSRYTPEFNTPDNEELISRVIDRWSQIPDKPDSSGDKIPDLALDAETAKDALASVREHNAIVCVAIPDPLFRLRHALAQLHLGLHYLDAIELSLKDRPLIHSATLIRQTLFDPQMPAPTDQIETLRAAVDREKLNKTLDHSERERVLEEMTVHMATLETLVGSGEVDVACGDYLSHGGLGPCEAFALQSHLLDLAQQIPGVLSAYGLESPAIVSRVLKQGLSRNLLVNALADGENTNSELPPLLTQLKKLAQKQDTLTEEHLGEVGLSSVSALAQQLKQDEGSTATRGSETGGFPNSISTASSVAGLVQTALGGWSAAILKTVERLRQSGDLTAIQLDRIFTSVRNVADIADPNLGGELQVMHRGAVDLARYSIVGVHGEGLSFGLTDADLQSEALTRRNDYLFADRTNAVGKKIASTSPARLAEEVGEAAVKAAAHTWVFVLPVGHPEARKFSALKFDWANKAKAIADGPGLSRVLVGLAAYNLASEVWSLINAKSERVGLSSVKSFGALLDLSAATMKLHVVSSPADDKLVAKVILRPLFEIKSLPVVGPLIQKRLIHVGASTIVRSMSVVNFFAGSIMVGVSAWDYRNSVNQGDLDAALGHGLAVTGGSIFLASVLLGGLLAIPGWGWALLGLGLVLGGNVYAAVATDSEMERVLKQGPLGLGPPHAGLPKNDAVYYSQLLSLFSPVTVSASRFGDLNDAEKAQFAGHTPSPDDYRVTVTSPLISRFKLGQSSQGNMPDLRLGVQELEYTQRTIETPTGNVDEFHLTRKTALKNITEWVPVAKDHAVHFLIERNLAESEVQASAYREQRTVSLRVVLQARIESEVGPFRFPVPVLDDYEPFDAIRHGELPDKKRHVFNPFENEPVPYWIVKEVAV